MLRLVLLVLYLIASSTSPDAKRDHVGPETDPSTDGGGGWDPFG